MKPYQDPARRHGDQPQHNCNVNMRFNFAVRAIALIAAASIGYVVFW